MTAEIVNLESRRPPQFGNGAREAVIGLYNGDVAEADYLLGRLWELGFMVVPIPGGPTAGPIP